MATKLRIEVKKNEHQNVRTFAAATEAASPVKVVAEATGPVTWLDKVKGYYKQLVGVVGAILVLVNEITPLTDFLPTDIRHWVSVGVAALTAINVGLVKNQTWVDNL